MRACTASTRLAKLELKSFAVKTEEPGCTVVGIYTEKLVDYGVWLPNTCDPMAPP